MRPVILKRPPGIGKSVWARRLGQALGLPTVDIDASKGGAGFAVAGVERGFGSSLPGRPLEVILARRVANPLVIVDTICKAKHAETTGGRRYAFADMLLSLPEPATAARWACIHFRLRFDMAHILWVMTANAVHLALDRAPRMLGRRLSLRDVIRMLERGVML